MTVRELLKRLLEMPMDCQVYVGKGMGVLWRADPANATGEGIFVVLTPHGGKAPTDD